MKEQLHEREEVKETQQGLRELQPPSSGVESQDQSGTEEVQKIS